MYRKIPLIFLGMGFGHLSVAVMRFFNLAKISSGQQFIAAAFFFIVAAVIAKD